MRIVRVVLVTALVLLCQPAWAQDKTLEALGAQIGDVTKADALKLKWDEPRGVKLVKPLPGSPAETSGLRDGDLIVSMDGIEIEGVQAFRAAIGGKPPGAQIKLRILRDGGEQRVTATLKGQVVANQSPKAKPEASPLRLMLDTGGHTAVINGLVFTPDGNFVISASDDKIIRVWDWRTGRTVRTIRGQSGAGDEGAIYAFALSPDGTKLAAAAYTAGDNSDIRLYDSASGKQTGLLKGHSDSVYKLAFSPDGTQLISGSGDHTAIIWDVARGSVLHQLKGHKDSVGAVGFTPDGSRAVTGSGDTTLRLWRVADGSLIKSLSGHTAEISAIDLSRRDGSIASGDREGEIRLWDGKTGKFLRVVANQSGSVGVLRFSPDGLRLLSTCGHGGCTSSPQHVWDVATGKELATYSGHDNVVQAADISLDGKLAATGGGNQKEIHIWETATGKRVSSPLGMPLTLGGSGASVWAVGFSPDGQKIAWRRTGGGTGGPTAANDRRPLEFQLRLPRLADEHLGQPEALVPSSSQQSAGPLWLRANAAIGPISLARRKGDNSDIYDFLDITRSGKVVASIERDTTDGGQHSSYTLTPDGQSLISGGNFGTLAAYDLVGHEGAVWAVTPSPDGKYLVSGSADQTIRLWNLKTFELIASLFHGSDGAWVMWTPQGYYTGSPGADSLIGWQINQGEDKEATYVTAAQLRQQFYRPDIVDNAIILASAEKAVAEANGTKFKLADLLARPTPKFRITEPADRSSVSGGRVKVRVELGKSPDPIKTYKVTVNGTLIFTGSLDQGLLDKGDFSFNVPLTKGVNKIVITLVNEVGESADFDGSLTLNHEGDGALDKRGKLYVLAIGVDKYPGISTCGADGKQPCDLTYSGADAAAFAETVVKSLGAQHEGEPIVQLLTNASEGAPPTAANILRALSSVRNNAQANDTVGVFVAGHGVLQGPDYLFMSTDAVREGRGWDGSSVIPWVALESAVFGSKGRRFLFVDTCHSAGAYNGKLGNNAFHNDVVAFTATGQDQLALEFGELKHGVFTYALIAGLAKGEADTDHDKLITVDKLGAYLKTKAHDLIVANDPNHAGAWPIPEMHKARDAGDHVIARVP